MILYLTCLAVSIASLSCQKPEDSRKPGNEPVKVTGFITEPESVSRWQHTLYLFSEGSCTLVASTDDAAGIEVAGEASGTAVAVACPSAENIDMGLSSDGLPAELYRISVKDMELDVPDIWTGRGTVDGGVTMSPLTATVRLELANVPELFSSVGFEIPNLANSLSLADGSLDIVPGNSSLRAFSMTEADTGILSRIFPMEKEVAAWKFYFSINMRSGAKIEDSFNVSVPVSGGSDNVVTLDFGSFDEDGTCMVKFSSQPYASADSKTWSKKVTVMAIQPENRYYDVDVLQSDGSWRELNPTYALCSNSPDYHTQIWNDWNNSRKLRDTMSFVSVIDDFSGPVTVRVVNKKPFSRVDIRPTAYGIVPSMIDDSTIEFTIPDYARRKLSVEFDGDRYHNLMIFGDRPDPDRPDPDAIPSGMKYYGPGEHEAGWITLKEGETLYIDEGATVYAKVNVIGDNTSIRGRGVLSGAHLAHTGTIYASGEQMIETNAGKVGTRQGFTVEGITVIDSPNWTFSIYNTDHVVIENMKMICWILNGDGIDLCSVDDALVKDCFIRTYDDCITLKVNGLSLSDTKNIRIVGNLIWTDYARGIVIGPESGVNTGGCISDVIVEGCTIMEYPTRLLQTSSTGYNCDGAGLSVSQYPSPDNGKPAGKISGITFRDIVVDRIGKAGRPLVIWQKPGQSGAVIEDIMFSNISIECPDGSAPCHIYTNGGTVRSLVMENVRYNGTPLQDSGMWFIDGTDVDIIYR
ncbi:MAG: glycosyl hydrolase family 28 protein [Clostridium sp.]|nr:glycosyl hydrolase family 28 protein [Bacteroides sp.]MCM1197360.1 glycosyl hydrolase family 28 protein [Clostridium sp.]